jgi:hypothetical protein
VADDVLRQGVQGISDLITVHGLVNLDFADVKTVMSNAGTALMGIGRASGENRAVEAAQQAISSPLLEVSIDGARGILFNVIGGLDMSMHEINSVAEAITAAADPEANIIFGATINPDLEGEIIVTVVATGFDESYYASRDIKTAELIRQAYAEPAAENKIDEATMTDLDMELKDDSTPAEDFHSEETPNIWALPDEQNMAEEPVADEDELEKPSFLRRLTGRKPHQDLEEFGADAEEPTVIKTGTDDNQTDDNTQDDTAGDDNDDTKSTDETEENAEKDSKTKDTQDEEPTKKSKK